MNETLLRASTAQIKNDRAVAGGGFLIASNGLIVTCAHVILAAGQKPGGQVIVFFPQFGSAHSATVLHEGWCDPKGDDLAFLKVEDKLPGDIAPVPLGSSAEATGHSFSSFGFPELRDESGEAVFDGAWANGQVLGIVHRRGGQVALQLRSFELDRGYSGAPILDLVSNRVIGIVTDVKRADPYKKQQFLAWATPSENIANAYPEVHVKHERHEAPNKLRPRFAHVLLRAQYFTGRKSQLRALREFWNRGTGGVLALVGIGGAGKTAIVRQFLEEQRWLKSDDAPERPDGLFVWSFYDSPDTTEFLTEVYRYFLQSLEEGQIDKLIHDGRRANVFLLADVLEKANRRFLLIMDGLEKMQSTGSRAGLPRGALIDPPLRHLLLRIADGMCSQTKAIVTSRFPLTDLADWAGNQHQEINVDKLEPEFARSLLRKIGVRGPRVLLDLLAEEYGSHALTLDLLGRLLVEYHNGDPSKVRGFRPLEVAAGSSAVEKQANKLARVLRAYETRLDPSGLTALECLSVFRRPVDFGFLVDVFLGENAPSISGAIAYLTSQRFRSILHVLAERQLVILERDADGREWYTTHQAVKDHFYIRLTDPKELHDAVRSRLATLVDAPGYIKPKDAKAIDLIEELIYHTVQVGRTSEAYSIYGGRLGYRHLGWDLGDHARGAGIARLFHSEDGTKRGDIEQRKWEWLTIDYGLYLKNLGLLDEAIQFFNKIVTEEEKEHEANVENLALALQNLSAVQVLRGLLQDAEVSARAALDYAIKTVDDRLVQDCRVRLATVLALQGQTNEAESVFQTVRSLTKERKEKLPRDWPGIRLGWLLMRLGRFSEAEFVLQETSELSKNFDFRIISARADVLIAELAYRTGKMEEVRQALSRVFSWASTTYDQEMVVAANLVSAWLALSEKDLQSAKHFVRDGLRVAEECGHSIYWIGLKIAQGYADLAEGKPENAEDCAKQALLGRVQTGGRPKLFGAQSNECGYLWGEGDALQLLAEAQLSLGNVQEAIDDLLRVREIRTHLGDYSLAETETALEKLNRTNSE